MNKNYVQILPLLCIVSIHKVNLYEIQLLQKSATTAADGKVYQVEYYILDAIISIGFYGWFP